MLVYSTEFLEIPYQTKNNKRENKPTSEKTGDTGGNSNDGKGCHKECNWLHCQPSFFSIKERWRAVTSDQSEGAEHIHTFKIEGSHLFKKISEQESYANWTSKMLVSMFHWINTQRYMHVSNEKVPCTSSFAFALA